MSTNYPGAKDSFPVHVDNNNEKIAAAAMNNVQDSITSIENVLGTGSTQPTTAATPNAIVVRDANGVDNSMGFSAAGLTGATSASRYVGATATGSPTTGTFAVGDFVIDQTGVIWICTTAGTPGTWTRVTPANAVSSLSGGTKVQSGVVNVTTSAATGIYTSRVYPPTAYGSTPDILVSTGGSTRPDVVGPATHSNENPGYFDVYINQTDTTARTVPVHWTTIGS